LLDQAGIAAVADLIGSVRAPSRVAAVPASAS
jgi:hypothetical protein